LIAYFVNTVNQKLSQSNRVSKDYSKSKVRRFFETQCICRMTFLCKQLPFGVTITAAVLKFSGIF